MVSPRHNVEFVHVFGLIVECKKWSFQNENLAVLAGEAARRVKDGDAHYYSCLFNWLAFKASESL